jgi:hypothetical protein
VRRENIAIAIGGATAALAVFSLSNESCGLINSGVGGAFDAGAPSMVIVTPKNGTCVVARPGEVPYVPISLDIENLQLEPPGVCSQQLTTVTTGVVGVGVSASVTGAGGTGGASISLPCGHITLLECPQAAMLRADASIWEDDPPAPDGSVTPHEHCPLHTVPNNQGSGTEIDVLLPDLRPPTPEMPVNKIHIDIQLVREASFVGQFIAPITVLPQGLNLDVVPPGAMCPAGAGGAGGAGSSN